jgi:CheY-like chemotaxis protein
VSGDEDSFYQCILNVCVNGVDSMSGRGELHITVDEDEQQNRVMVSVRDHGVGIAEEISTRIFEPLFTTRAHLGGTGLGLAIAHRAMTTYGGSINVQSEVGVGTTVTLLFVPSASRSAPPPETQARSLAGISLLFVDDDDRVRAATMRLLRVMRCKVEEFSNGHAALEAVGMRRSFDVAVIDINMNGMNGPELVQHLFERFGPIPVVFIPGAAGDLVPKTMLARPYVQLLRKPYAATELSRVITRVLDAVPLEARST